MAIKKIKSLRAGLLLMYIQILILLIHKESTAVNSMKFKDTVAIPEFSGKKPINFEITISRRYYHV